MISSELLSSEIYHLSLNIVFLISSIIFILMLYLIFKQSSRLEDYRFYLLNNIIWAYVLLTLLFISKPRFLFPMLLVYFDGPLKHCGPFVVYGIMYALMITKVNMICGILMTLGFRYGQLLPFSVSTFAKKKKLFWPCVIGEHLIGYICIILPAMTINCNQEIVAKVAANTQMNFTSPFTTYSPYLSIPSLFTLELSYFKFTLYLTYAIASGYILIMGIAYLHMKFIVRCTTNRVFYFTYQMQNMLVNAYAAETLATLIFIILPILFGLYVTEQKIYYSSLICESLIILSSFYPIILFTTIIFFVKPYQQFLKRGYWFALSKLPLGFQHMVNGSTINVEAQINMEQQFVRRKSIQTICYTPNDFLPQYDGYM